MSKFCSCFRQPVQEVRTLEFRHCSLATLPSEVFAWERTLEELNVDANEIRDLPRELFHCHGLRKLTISDNDLQSIPPAIASLINLEELDVSKNGIVELPENIKCCKRLSVVEASVNPLGKLPDGFTQLLNLTQLYLNDTFLDYLPGNFGRLSRLKILEVRENHLKTLPKSICRLIDLERLDIGQNDFIELPEVIGSLPGLLELWCDSNQITTIPGTIGSLKQLMYIDASKNRIETLPSEIEGCVSLSDLHLSSNCLKQLPETIGRLSNMTTIKAEDNQLELLPFSIGGLVSLSELNISCNDLKDLPPSIGLLRHLRTLYADENFIEEIPPELGSCGGLTVLSLRCNKLQYIPDEIGRIPRLRVLNLSDNQLQCLPFSFTRLKQLQALWLSENQAQPLIPLQTDVDPLTGQHSLTCYLLPQQRISPSQSGDIYDDVGSFHSSVWDEERAKRQLIQFDVAVDNRSEGRVVLAANTPYPKAHPRHNKNLALHNQAIVKKGESQPSSTDNQTYGDDFHVKDKLLGNRAQNSKEMSPQFNNIDHADGLISSNIGSERSGASKDFDQYGLMAPHYFQGPSSKNYTTPISTSSPVNHSISDFRQVNPNIQNVFQPRLGNLVRESHSDYALQNAANMQNYQHIASTYQSPYKHLHHYHHPSHHRNGRNRRNRDYESDIGYRSDTGYRSDSAALYHKGHSSQRGDTDQGGYSSDWDGSARLMRSPHRSKQASNNNYSSGYTSDTGHIHRKMPSSKHHSKTHSQNLSANNLLSDQLYDSKRGQVIAHFGPNPASESLSSVLPVDALNLPKVNQGYAVSPSYPHVRSQSSRVSNSVHRQMVKPSPLQHQRLMNSGNVSSSSPSSEDEVFRPSHSPSMAHNMVTTQRHQESPDRELSRYMSRQESPSMAVIPEHRLPPDLPKHINNNDSFASSQDKAHTVKSPPQYKEVSMFKNNGDLPMSQISSSDSGYQGNSLMERMQELRLDGSPVIPPPSRTPPSPPRYTPISDSNNMSFKDTSRAAAYAREVGLPKSREGTPSRSREGTPSRVVEQMHSSGANDTGNWQKMAVNVVKNPGLGFSIAGGIGSSRNPFRPMDDGIFVTKVQPNGPAATQLHPGDKLLQVNGVDFNMIEHHRAVSVLKGSIKNVTLIIERDVSV